MTKTPSVSRWANMIDEVKTSSADSDVSFWSTLKSTRWLKAKPRVQADSFIVLWRQKEVWAQHYNKERTLVQLQWTASLAMQGVFLRILRFQIQQVRQPSGFLLRNHFSNIPVRIPPRITNNIILSIQDQKCSETGGTPQLWVALAALCDKGLGHQQLHIRLN